MLSIERKNHLLPGESFTTGDKLEESVPLFSDDEINEKYKRGEIRIVTEQAR